MGSNSSMKGKQSSAYDLYGVVNHHMFQSQGGHYTAFIQKMMDSPQQDPNWILCNDQRISHATLN
jgi:uncharacterized UBP type Zn finger protein